MTTSYRSRSDEGCCNGLPGLLLLLMVLCTGVVDVLPRAAAAKKARASAKPVVKGSLGRSLDEAVLKAGGEDFWGSVLVAKKGRVLLAKGYGMADHKRKPNTPLTLFEMASASKQFTAAAILHLQQRKKLKVTDTLGTFFKDVPEHTKDIQLHHLLTHTSGISPRSGVAYASPITRDRFVAQMLSGDLVSSPGEKYEYCNAAYALLAAVVEEVADVSFEAYTQKWIFGPAGMSSTGFIGDKKLARSKQASVRKIREPGSWNAAKWHWGWGYRGMGGVVTTVYDLLRWDRALRGDKILNKESREQLYRPFKDGYAYGWRVAKVARGRRKVEHTGNVEGYGTSLIRHLEDDVLIVVFSNHAKPAYEVGVALEARTR